MTKTGVRRGVPAKVYFGDPDEEPDVWSRDNEDSDNDEVDGDDEFEAQRRSYIRALPSNQPDATICGEEPHGEDSGAWVIP